MFPLTIHDIFTWTDDARHAVYASCNAELDIFLGALSGAAIFTITVRYTSKIKKTVFFISSFFTGVAGAHFTASIITLFSPQYTVVPPSVGALVASVISVRLLLRLNSVCGKLLQRWLNAPGK